METKTINCKMKEIYYNPRPIEEETKVVEYRFKFWSSMNVMAIQNMSLQQLKMV